MKPFMAVYENASGKSTSSFLTSVLAKGIKLLVGIDAFKAAWKREPTVQDSVAAANGMSPSQLAAQLRMNGIDPDEYYDALGNGLGDNIDQMDSAQINDVLAKAQAQAADPKQSLWLWAVIGIGIMALTGYGARKGIRKGFRRLGHRVRHYGARIRGRFRGRRRR